MFKRRRAPLVQSFLMSLLMVTIMTFLVTAVNTGFTEGFMSRWGHSYLIAWPIAFTIIMLMGRRVQALSVKLCSID